MGDPDSRLGFVDVLSAGTGGFVRCDLNVLVLDLNGTVIVEFGHYFYRCKGGLPSARGVKG